MPYMDGLVRETNLAYVNIKIILVFIHKLLPSHQHRIPCLRCWLSEYFHILAVDSEEFLQRILSLAPSTK